MVSLIAVVVGLALGQWRVLGPGGGGAQFHPAISPHDSRKVLVACDMTGSYLSEDGGSIWRMLNLRGVSRQFVWDPKDRSVVYARGRVLFRSADGGHSWRLAYPPEKRLSGVDMANDHADETLLVEGGPARAMSAFTTDGRRWWAAFGPSLESSADEGMRWEKETTFATAVRKLWWDGNALIAAGESRLWRREGGQWRQSAPLPEAWVDIDGYGRHVYAATAHHVFVSSDSGAHWSQAAVPGEQGRFTAVAASAAAPETAWVGYGERNVNGRIVFGVARSRDGGATWSLPWAQDQANPSYIRDAWMTPALGAGWGGEPLTLGAAPGDANVVYATDLGRTLRSRDGGQTWEAVYSRPQGTGWTSTGLDVTTCYGVHFDPFDKQRVLISYTDIGQMRSEDGGRSWQSSLAGIPRQWRNTTYWIVFDPAVRGRAWAATSQTHDLPRPKMWRRSSPSQYKGGVVRSSDGGRTWQVSNEGMAPSAVTHLVLDETSPVQARVLYAAAFGRGVYKSADGGRSWVLKARGLPQKEPLAWRLALDRTGGLYLVVARRSEDGRTGDEQDGALYYSGDGAENWRKLPLPAGLNGPNGLAVDTQLRGRIYLAAWARTNEPRQGKGGIWASEDAGRSWRQVFAADQHVYDVTTDPRLPGRLYGCGFESSAWRSDDSGRTWTRIAGYDFKWGHRVVPDPADPAMIFVTTFGGSVWHGPAAGGGKQALQGIYVPGK